MIKQLKYKNITWIDIESPTKEELVDITKKYSIHSLVIEELLSPTSRSRVDSYEDYLYLILHFPPCQTCYAPGAHMSLETEEVDFVIGKDFLITTHYQPMAQLEELSKILEINSTKSEKNEQDIHAGHLFSHIVKALYTTLEDGLEYVNQRLRETEKYVFSGHEQEMVATLSEINRTLIDFRWALKSHNEVLTSMDLLAQDFFGPKFKFKIRSIIGEYERIWAMLESNREVFNEIRQTNESLLAIKTNDIMKILTILAFVTFPLSVFTSVFGMNTKILPLVGLPYDFWIIVGIMVAAVIAMFIFFRYNKWL